jgi:hypothetical protein
MCHYRTLLSGTAIALPDLTLPRTGTALANGIPPLYTLTLPSQHLNSLMPITAKHSQKRDGSLAIAWALFASIEKTPLGY